jgi:hypothetical protein
MLKQWTKNYTQEQKERIKELRVVYDEAMAIIMATDDTGSVN